MQFELLIKQLARRFGVDLRAYRPARSEAARLARMLKRHRIDTVLDVGANTGQFARHLRSIGYHGRIICFDPLSEAHAALVKLARRDPALIVAPRQALGESSGEVEIKVSANLESSSILPVSDAHLRAEPRVRTVAVEKVPMRRLDDAVLSYLSPSDRVFLKIDVQGYELPVLRGAERVLGQVLGVQLELSLQPLYQGEPLFREVIDAVEALGFALHDVNPCFSDDATGRTYQVDGVFFRNEAS
ncbi:FkbM family methyltransferase [Geomonas azotofigens]|uniref:FkbM family methyltransferase n=1 Tax=Geomonas azotofigens TaxID=2843196 RepID=UPI001C0FC195|nr:FkbM family methyltransferase [Geomonas azotofigens]MBU5612536.1 FkbM family methyltransferase [Geomonas azotofigens]